MKTTVGLVCVLALVVAIGAPPVVENSRRAKAPPEPNDSQGSDDVLDQLEYSRYLKEVVEILESDPDFKRKLEKATVEEIKSGDIAEHLNYVQHHVRTRLDEAKQREMARLRDLMQRKVRGLSEKQRKMLARADPQGRRLNEMLPKHVDHGNSETFEQGDLERLIRHATKDLDEIDRQREQEFKQYEMRKEYDRRKRLAKLDDEDRRRLEKLHREALEKKKNHRKVNHPGSVDQMEEVWEKVDKLEADQFTPKSFFKLHDINGDGFLDEGEIEAIMLKEAAKIHEEAPEADPVEKEEEMERMRQHVMKEFDKNNDRMLSLAEFELGVNGTGAKNDQGWQSIEDKEVYSNQEFQRFSEQMDPVSTSIPREQTPPTTTVRQQPAVNASVSEPASSSIAPAGQPIRGAAPEVRNA